MAQALRPADPNDAEGGFEVDRMEREQGGTGSLALKAGWPAGTLASAMTGSPSQVEWAEQIKKRVGEEFERVKRVFLSVAAKQTGRKQADTELILTILEEKRVLVMSRPEAGYFIHHWQEINDQVRNMIGEDCRFDVIRTRRKRDDKAS